MTSNNEYGNEVPKMPSMKHLPWSQEDARQQKWLTKEQTKDMFFTENSMNQIVITEKMDGANACLTKNKVYARSHSGEPHREEWDYLKKLHREELMHNIPEDFAIFGEYMYARHSIKYENIPVFLVFGVYYKPRNEWMAWYEVKNIAHELGLETVPEIATLRLTDLEDFLEIGEEFKRYNYIEDREPEGESRYGDTREGYVIRNTERFKIDELTENMAKCVRENHVQTEELHWRKGGETETNGLR